MGDITEKKVMGWYGKCPECQDLELADLGDTRYLIGSIYRVKGVQWDSPWEPATKLEESGEGGPALYDANHNPLFTKLECGNAYLIVNPDANTISIPNFEKDGGLVTEGEECCGSTPLSINVNCKCDNSNCENPSVEECEGWTEQEVFNACQHLRTDPDAEDWTESLVLWYDPLAHAFLGVDTQFHDSEAATREGTKPNTSVLSPNYVHVRTGSTDSFMQFDESGKVLDVINCDFSNKVLSVKTCKHDDYGWILLVKEGSQGVYRPIYTEPGLLTVDRMPGSSPVEVVDIPEDWTVQKTGSHIDDLVIASAVTDLWGSSDGGTRYLTVGVGGVMHTAYYHSDSNPVEVSSDESCETPDVGNTSISELPQKNLVCFNGALNDGTEDAKCVLPITDCCSDFEHRHSVAVTAAEYPCDPANENLLVPQTIDGTTYTGCVEFHSKFTAADSPDKQCCEEYGEMELRKVTNAFANSPIGDTWSIRYMCHNNLVVSGELMGTINVESKHLSFGTATNLPVVHGQIGFGQECCGEVVVTLINGECIHGCVRKLTQAEQDAGEKILFVPIDEELQCDCG
jgi:hypothetical protein